MNYLLATGVANLFSCIFHCIALKSIVDNWDFTSKTFQKVWFVMHGIGIYFQFIILIL